jgi:hypothetical protein
MLGAFRLYNIAPAEAVFFAWVIQMQLIEYFLWKSQPCNNESATFNVQTTKIGIVVNHMEPIVFWLAILHFSKRRLPHIVNLVMIMFIVHTIIYTKRVLQSAECTTVTPESDPHLHWKWNDAKHNKWYYSFFILVLLLLSMYGLDNGLPHVVIVLVSYLVSYCIYGDKHSTGAMWCFAAAFGPWVLQGIYNR